MDNGGLTRMTLTIKDIKVWDTIIINDLKGICEQVNEDNIVIRVEDKWYEINNITDIEIVK